MKTVNNSGDLTIVWQHAQETSFANCNPEYLVGRNLSTSPQEKQ